MQIIRDLIELLTGACAPRRAGASHVVERLIGGLRESSNTMVCLVCDCGREDTRKQTQRNKVDPKLNRDIDM